MQNFKNKAEKKSFVKHIIICVGGNGPDNIMFLKTADFCIAADAGILLCKKLGYDADVLIGDFDTVSKNDAKEYFPKAKIITHPTHKDKTDTELALLYAHNYYKKYSVDISIIGGEGGSVDHFLGILHLCASLYAPKRIITKTQQLEVIRGNFSVHLKMGSKISFLAIGSTPTVQTSTGLLWPLDNICLSQTHTSLRNEVSDLYGRVSVTLQQGCMFAIWNHADRYT